MLSAGGGRSSGGPSLCITYALMFYALSVRLCGGCAMSSGEHKWGRGNDAQAKSNGAVDVVAFRPAVKMCVQDKNSTRA